MVLVIAVVAPTLLFVRGVAGSIGGLKYQQCNNSTHRFGWTMLFMIAAGAATPVARRMSQVCSQISSKYNMDYPQLCGAYLRVSRHNPTRIHLRKSPKYSPKAPKGPHVQQALPKPEAYMWESPRISTSHPGAREGTLMKRPE